MKPGTRLSIVVLVGTLLTIATATIPSLPGFLFLFALGVGFDAYSDRILAWINAGDRAPKKRDDEDTDIHGGAQF